MQSWIELVKSLIRPFIITWGCVVYGICVIGGIAVPDLLSGLVAAAVIEYFGERAFIRLKGNSSVAGVKGE